MNTLVIVLIAAVVLVCAYAGYGRWLAKTWGVDPNAKTPAVRLEDGKDYVPTNGWTVFAHQFSSIAGAGPVTGAIQAAAFGWLPVLLWVLLALLAVVTGNVYAGGMDYAAQTRAWLAELARLERKLAAAAEQVWEVVCGIPVGWKGEAV